MSGKPTKHAELLLLCGKVRDEALRPEDAARLDGLLQSSDEAKRLYVEYMSVASILESRGVGQEQPDGTTQPAGTVDHDLLAELLEQEQEAEVAVVAQPEVIRLKEARDKEAWQLAGAWRFVVRQPAVWGAVAAAVVLTVTLVIVLTGGSEQPERVAEQPGNTGQPSLIVPDEPEANPAITPAITSGVATLTAERGAVWDRRPGDKLVAGDRLNLTQGTAEITTARGAIAILQAPATIEMIDNPNAMRLIRGSIAGICETPTSKGFFVRTPHLDVTDIGTRFGIIVDADGASTVQVFKGSVMVEPSNQSAPGAIKQRVLKAGDATKVDRFGLETNEPGLPQAHLAGLDQLTQLAKYDADKQIARISGDVELARRENISILRELDATSQAAYLFEEARLVAAEDLVLTASRVGDMLVKPGNTDTPQASTVPAGTAIRSYILIANRSTKTGLTQHVGAVTFENEVLGVIVDGEHWVSFVETTEANHDVVKVAADSGNLLELPGTPNAGGTDKVRLSNNRRTLNFEFNRAGNPDMIRIVVRANPEQANN
ncbi:MAG: FecR domain-containing protein [Planctomycetota bacterium]